MITKSISNLTNNIEGDIICIKVKSIYEYRDFIDICSKEGYVSLVSSESHLNDDKVFFDDIYFIFHKNYIVPLFDVTNEKINIVSLEKFKFLLGINISRIFVKVYFNYVFFLVESHDGFYKHFSCYINEDYNIPNSIITRHSDNLLGGNMYESYSIKSVVNKKESFKEHLSKWLNQFYDYEIYSFDLINDYDFFDNHDISIKKPFVCLKSIFDFHEINIEHYDNDTKTEEYLKSYILKFKSIKK